MRSIAEQQTPPNFTTLLTATGLPKGTLHRILQALIAENLVRRSETSKTYHLGLDLLKLANAALAGIHLRDVARDECTRLRNVTGETVNLVARDQLKAIIIDRLDTAKAVNSNESIGLQIHLHCAAAGKAIAAFLSSEDLDLALHESRLKKFTPKTITSKKVLRLHLGEVRRQGYATNEGETDPSVFGIAAPIFDLRNEVVGSMNLTIPQYRLEPDEANHHIRAVMDAAQNVSRAMGYISC